MEITSKDIEKFKESWANCIVKQDLDNLIGLYNENAFLKPTLSEEIRNNLERIKAYFVGEPEGTGFLHQGITKVEYSGEQSRIKGNIAILCGHYHFTKGEVVDADYTFVLEKVAEDKVEILSQHSSLTYK